MGRVGWHRLISIGAGCSAKESKKDAQRSFMLNRKHYTTPLLKPSERRRLEEVPVAKPKFWRVFWIAGWLLLLVIDVARDPAAGGTKAEARATRIREFLERLGGMWIKLGQVLAMRSDLFSREFCKELSKLHDRAMTFSPRLSREIIEKNLGRPIEEVFDDFEPLPFAAASLSQVHRAKLKEDGAVVVIKVQRPYVEEYFHYDFKVLGMIFRFLSHLNSLRHFQLNEMLQEIHIMMDEEVDYRQEASNMVKLKATLADHKVYVPDVYLDLSTNRVLVMEFIDGVFMSDFHGVMTDDPERAGHWLEENNIDTVLVARRLLQSAMRQLFEDLLFHGDLHWGNIIMLRDSRFALIDFGAVGRLDPKFAAEYDQYFRAMAEGAFDRAAELLLMTMERLPPVDLLKLKGRIVRVLEKQSVRSSIQNLPYHQKSIAAGSAELSQVLGEFRVAVNWQFLKMARTFETVDQNIAILNPKFDFVEEMRLYLQGKAKRARCKRLKQPFDLIGKLSDLYELFAPALTRKTLQFEGQVSVAARVAATLFRFISVMTLVAFVLGIWIFLYQERIYVAYDLQMAEHWFNNWVASIPAMHRYAWLVLGGVALYVVVRARRFAASLLTPPVGPD